jgi:phosphoribosylformylglycinamidine (FGAM) synthase PurS component
MTTFTIEIRPKKSTYDPLARGVQAELLELGEKDAAKNVVTERLYRISGDFIPGQMETIADTLLLDPVVETASVSSDEPIVGKKKTAEKKPKKKIGFILDIWPKAGVTDPVGETVEKGLRDLSLRGIFHACSGQRYIFPNASNAKTIEALARSLANQLIHDINIRTLN